MYVCLCVYVRGCVCMSAPLEEQLKERGCECVSDWVGGAEMMQVLFQH